MANKHCHAGECAEILQKNAALPAVISATAASAPIIHKARRSEPFERNAPHGWSSTQQHPESIFLKD
jgi:hypothetical protein